MQHILSEKKNAIKKAIILITVYTLLGILIMSISQHDLYLRGLKRIITSAVLCACVSYFWSYSKQFLAVYAGMTFFFASSIWIRFLDGLTVRSDTLLSNLTLAGMYWPVILLIWLGLAKLGTLTGHVRAGRFLSRIWLVVTLFIACLPNLILWAYFAVSHHYLRSDIVMTIYQTNKAEALAYLSMQPVFYLLLAAVLSAASVALLFHLVHKVCVTAQTGVSTKRRGWVTLFFIGLFLIAGAKTSCSLADYEPYHIGTSVQDAIKNYQAFATNKERRIANLKKLGSLQTMSGYKGVYVLIIGESETRDHMSVYGYSRDTTPWLKQFSQDPGTLIYRNSFSNHVHTVPTLTYALGEKNQYNRVAMDNAYSIIEVANAAGFDTYRISNQERYGAWDTPVAEIASTAKHQLWLNGEVGESLNTAYLDEALAEKAPDIQHVNNALIVFHLMGEHGRYEDRYPAEYEYFHQGKNRNVDCYDNAVRYTDYVLSLLYDKVAHNPHFQGFIYFSDHGEEPDQKKYHESTKFTNQMTHIPLIMHFSAAYRTAHPQVFATLKSQEEDYWTNDLLYNVMLEIMGIQGTSLVEPNLTLGNPAYDRTKENLRTLHGERKLEQ